MCRGCIDFYKRLGSKVPEGDNTRVEADSRSQLLIATEFETGGGLNIDIPVSNTNISVATSQPCGINARGCDVLPATLLSPQVSPTFAPTGSASNAPLDRHATVICEGGPSMSDRTKHGIVDLDLSHTYSSDNDFRRSPSSGTDASNADDRDPSGRDGRETDSDDDRSDLSPCNDGNAGQVGNSSQFSVTYTDDGSSNSGQGRTMQEDESVSPRSKCSSDAHSESGGEEGYP